MGREMVIAKAGSAAGMRDFVKDANGDTNKVTTGVWKSVAAKCTIEAIPRAGVMARAKAIRVVSLKATEMVSERVSAKVKPMAIVVPGSRRVSTQKRRLVSTDVETPKRPILISVEKLLDVLLAKIELVERPNK